MDRNEALRQWDKARAYIAQGRTGSWPRDMFESYLDRITELEAALEKYGRHERSCGCIEFELAGRVGLIEIHGQEKKCTCGLDQALKGGR